jgi:lipopolysaccharide export system permease protein
VKRVDSLILREIIGPWCFGIAMFSMLIFASTYLLRLSDFFVQGAGADQIIQLTLLLLPSVVIKTFSMAILLAGLLAFGRLSSDSELVAMRAAGISIRRMMRPVAIFSVAVAVASFCLNEGIVPPATMSALKMQSELSRRIKSLGDQRLAAAENDSEGHLKLLLAAGDFDVGTRTLRRVTITSFNKAGEPTFYLYVPTLRFQSEKNWRIIGGGKLTAADGGYSMVLKGDAWPPEVPELAFNPQDFLRQNLKELDAFSLAETRQQIEEGKHDPQVTKKQLANLEYGLWNKFALPLASLVYGLLGASLGIRNVRTGTATGFAVSVAIIFAYVTLANLMAVYASGGGIPAYVASFTPVVLGLIAAGVIIWRRNG